MTRSATFRRRMLAPRHIASALITCVALVGFTAHASAQSGRFSLEGRGGMTFATGDFSGTAGAGSGFAAGLDAMYNLIPALTTYAGLSRDEFDGGFSSTGGQLGVKFLPMPRGSFMPWVAGGVLGQRLDVDGATSDFEVGLEAGAGADIEVTPMFTLSPGIRYRSYDAGFGAGQISPRYFAVALGAHLHIR